MTTHVGAPSGHAPVAWAAPTSTEATVRWTDALPPQEFASFGRRVAAAVIDAAVSLGLGAVACVVAVAAVAPFGSRSLALVAATVAFLAVFVPYTPLLHASAWQATLGKRLLGIVVVDLDGRRLSPARSWARFWLSFALGQFVVPNLTPLFNAKRQATHDMAANTVVVHGRR